MNAQPETITFKPIGYVKSPHTNSKLTPIQPCFAKGINGSIELNQDLEDGLSDIEGFSHIIVIYYFHRSNKASLKVTPFLDKSERGVFATRYPHRPNWIGISILSLISRKGNILNVSDIDILDKTPVLDIKPYVKDFDYINSSAHGWYDTVNEEYAQRIGKRKE